MSNLILHIGIHKTATTYLQKQYFPNCEGVEVIDFYKYFYNNIKSSSDQNLLISNEGLSGIPWNENWLKGIHNDFEWIDSFQACMDRIKRVFNNPTIVILFRKHGDLIISMYKQYIQEGGMLTLNEFYGEDGVIKPSNLIFSKRIDTLNKLFDNVYFLSYEDFRMNEKDYFDNFFSIFNISKRKNEMSTSVNDNISISGKKIELLRKINKMYFIPISLKRKLRRFRISPRDIFQSRLRFWKTKDSIEIINFKENINKRFKSDWEYFEKMKWNYIKK